MYECIDNRPINEYVNAFVGDVQIDEWIDKHWKDDGWKKDDLWMDRQRNESTDGSIMDRWISG